MVTETLERLKTEAERWIGAVAGDGSLAGQAAAEMRHLLNIAAAISSPTGPSSRDLWEAANVFRQSFHYDPGHSDLDRDQPITITVTLGSWRDLNWALNSLDATPSPIEKEKS